MKKVNLTRHLRNFSFIRKITKHLPTMAAGFLICMSLFTSCENFMDSTELKKKIAEEIEWANKNSLKVEIATSNTLQGTISPVGLQSIKVGETINIEFRMNPSYTFSRFEVIDKSTYGILKDAVEFSEIDERPSGNMTLFKTTAKLLVENENLLITPVCGLKSDANPPEIISDTFLFAKDKDNFDSQNYCCSTSDYYLWSNTDLIKNHIKDSLYFNFNILEAESSVSQIYIMEYYDREYGNNYKDAKITPLVTQTKISEFNVSFDYKLQSDSDGLIILKIFALDSGQNKSEPKTVYVSKDTAMTANFYLINFHGNYREPGTTTVLTDVNDFGGSSGYCTTSQLPSKVLNSDGSLDMSFRFYATRDRFYYDDTYPENLIFKYAYSNDREKLDNIAMEPIVFAENDSYKDVSIKVPDTTKKTYIKIYGEDAIGNSRSEYFEIPAVPKILSGYVVTETSSSGGYSYKRLKTNFTEQEDSDSTIYKMLYTHTTSTITNDDWEIVKKSAYFSTFSESVVGSYSPTSYNELTQTPFYARLVYKYSDYEGNDRYIYGMISDEQTAKLTSATYTAPEAAMTITAQEKDTHKISVQISEGSLANYECFFIKNDNIGIYQFNETGLAEFEVPTSVFYTINNSRTERTFSLYGVNEGKESEAKTFTISETDSSIVDNVAPTLPDELDSDKRDYTGQKLAVKISDTGDGLPNWQTVTIKYESKDMTHSSEKAEYLYSGDTTLNIPIAHLPDSTKYNITFSVSDSKGNTTTKTFDFMKDNRYIGFYGQNAKMYTAPQASAGYFQFYYMYDDYSSKDWEPYIEYDSIGDSGTSWTKVTDYVSSSHQMSWSSYSAPYSKYPLYAFNKKNGSDVSEHAFIRLYISEEVYSGWYFGGPFYFYTGLRTTTASMTVKDIQETLYGANIYCDKPFYVHTLHNKINYGSDVTEWETHCTSDMVAACACKTTGDYSQTPYHFALTPEQFKYSIPEEDYYVTIVHFADGSSCIGTVKQK
ncbi:MAG: hypothetical protein II821_01610 [Treponema sp.]|nr:hypothetical protein [Treponema sp.]